MKACGIPVQGSHLASRRNADIGHEMTRAQEIASALKKLPIPAFLVGRASVVLMSREGARPALLRRFVDEVRSHWKAAEVDLDGHVDACLMRASLAIVGRVADVPA
jgi:hypothetical protein